MPEPPKNSGSTAFCDVVERPSATTPMEVSAGRQGVPQSLIFGLYGLAALAWVWHFRVELLATAATVLAAAAVLFAVSFGIDILLGGSDATWRIVIEDGTKFMAILTLAVWAAAAGADLLEPRLRAGRDQPRHRPRTAGRLAQPELCRRAILSAPRKRSAAEDRAPLQRAQPIRYKLVTAGPGCPRTPCRSSNPIRSPCRSRSRPRWHRTWSSRR